MNVANWLGNLIGLEDVQSIDQIDPDFGAAWAHQSPAWVVLGAIALIALAFVYYLKYQHSGRRRARLVLATMRGLLLALILIILADPILTLRFTNRPRPLLYVLFDGSDSMAIEDDLPDETRKEWSRAVGMKTGTASKQDAKPQRIEYVRALLRRDENNLVDQLSEKFRVRAFMADRPDGVRSLATDPNNTEESEATQISDQLTTEGRVTALGRALEDLAERHATGHLAGVVVVSDFAQNSGPAPVGSSSSPVSRLGVPVYTVGVGATAAADLSVALRVRPILKKAERDVISVELRQSELQGQPATVRLSVVRRTDEMGRDLFESSRQIGEKTVSLNGPVTLVEFPYLPEETGRFELIAEVDPLDAEVITENNRVTRETSIRDDFLRLLYVAYEPTWEWRFIKEVFHRDKLVGLRGFRTFLRSSDPKVRNSNDLFLPTLTPPRGEFFASDVLFLDDMPANALSDRFCEMTKELVSQFGAGLVVIAGSRFGPAELAQTPLADLLPVVIDPSARLRDSQPFRLQLSDAAARTDFMRLGATDEENQRAWTNLGELPWYQPVARAHPQAEVLAYHPTDKSADGTTPQPLIAMRQFGNGKVVYLGFNETWRLRRLYGEQYYRQFWGQMIYHLGLRHALGAEKRFVVRTDRQQYQADDVVTVTVEAYDENFEALAAEKLASGQLTGQWISPVGDGQAALPKPIDIPISRQGVFETRFPVLQAGEHRLRVRDPVTNNETEVVFQVTDISVERQRAVRNVSLEREIALASGGASYDLTNVSRLSDEVNLPSIIETHVKVFPLWSTWLCFLLVLFLMFAEWLLRKRINLA